MTKIRPNYKAAVQAMEVALEATLLEQGFLKHAPANYLLDCGTHNWRVVFGPEYRGIKGSFREAVGLVVPEWERIYREVIPETYDFATRMAGTSCRAHIEIDITGSVYNRQIAAHWTRVDGLSWPQRKLCELGLWPDDRPQTNDFRNQHPWYRHDYERGEDYVVTEGFDIEEIGRVFDTTWRNCAWPRIEPSLTTTGLVETWFSGFSFRESLSRAILCWINGDHEGSEEVVRNILESGQETADEIRDRKLKLREYRQMKKQKPKDFERRVRNAQASAREWADDARRFADLVGMRLD